MPLTGFTSVSGVPSSTVTCEAIHAIHTLSSVFASVLTTFIDVWNRLQMKINVLNLLQTFKGWLHVNWFWLCIHLLVSQVFPVYPAAQLHVKPFTPSTHCPPFLQASSLHSLMSGRITNENESLNAGTFKHL